MSVPRGSVWVGLPPRPAAARPPEQLASTESRYVAQLLAAYADHKKTAVSDVQSLRSWPNLNEHFGRQREAFYHAESLRVFARDTVPAGTFESLQDDIHSGVIDVWKPATQMGLFVCEALPRRRGSYSLPRMRC